MKRLILALSIPTISAPAANVCEQLNQKKDLCLHNLQDFTEGKAILNLFTADLSTCQTLKVDLKYQTTSRRKKVVPTPGLFKNKSDEVHLLSQDSFKVKIDSHSIMKSLRFNILLGDIYIGNNSVFTAAASQCIDDLEQYKPEQPVNRSLKLSPRKGKNKKAQEDEMYHLCMKMNVIENERQQALIDRYKEIIKYQKGGGASDLSQLASDGSQIASDLYNSSCEHSDDLFYTINLILMRSAEIFLQENSWKQNIKPFEKLIPTIQHYETKRVTEVFPHTIFPTIFKISDLEKVLEEQKTILLEQK